MSEPDCMDDVYRLLLAGSTAEEVAQESGLTVEHVRTCCGYVGHEWAWLDTGDDRPRWVGCALCGAVFEGDDDDY